MAVLNKETTDFTIFVNNDYPGDNFEGLTTKEIYRLGFYHTFVTFRYRYVEYNTEVYYKSSNGFPLKAIYQKAIEQIDINDNFEHIMYPGEHYIKTGNVNTTKDHEIYHNPMLYVPEILAYGEYGRTYYVLHRLDTLDVKEILSKNTYNENDYSILNDNIKSLQENYNKSTDKRLIAVNEINKLRSDLDDILEPIVDDYNKKLESIRLAPFEYNIVDYGDLFFAFDSKGVKHLYRSYGMYAHWTIKNKQSISYRYGDLVRPKKFTEADLVDQVYYRVIKMIKKTGLESSGYLEEIPTSSFISPLGKYCNYSSDDIINMFKRKSTSSSEIRPMRRTKAPVTNTTDAILKLAIPKSKSEIISELNLLMEDFINKIKIITFGYDVIIERIEDKLMEYDKYNVGDVILHRCIDGTKNLSMCVGDMYKKTMDVISYSISPYRYSTNKTIIRKDIFSEITYTNVCTLIKSNGYIPKKKNFISVRNEDIIKIIDNIGPDVVLSGKDLRHILRASL